MANGRWLAGLVCAVIASGGAACRTPQPPPVPRPVVLITIDTWRADRLTADVAPELARFAATGVRFTNARTAVPLTLPSHATLLTGRTPPAHGVHVNGQRLDGDVPTLGAALGAAGYQTAAFVGAYVLDGRFGLSRGFGTYDDRVARDWRRAERLDAERPATTVVDAALAWLEAAPPGPFFLWVHLYDPHAPYDPPEPYRTRFAGRPYDGEVAYASAEAGRLLAGLETRGRLDDAVVVLAGDHGEGLGDHGESTHGMLAYDATLRVPLVVRAPGLTPAEQAAPVSLADVAGTVLRLSRTGATLPGGSARDLFDGDTSAEVYAETEYPATAGWHPLQVLAGASRKLIRSSTIEFYDVGADPGETTDLAARETAAARAAVARLTQRAVGSRPSERPSAEAEARLRSLGYASGPSARDVAAHAPNPASAIEDWAAFERISAADGGAGDLATLGALAGRYPDGFVFATTYARALAARGRHAEAVRVLKDAAARFPPDAALFHDLAVAARAAGDSGEALRAELAALAIDASYPAAQHGLGLLQTDAGRHGEARAAYAKAADLDPSNAAYWSDLGNACRDAGDPRAAEQAYDRALAVAPSYGDALNGRGVLLVQAGRPAEAIAWFTRALDAAPDLYEARLNLGIAYQMSGRTRDAVAALQDVLRRAPATAARERQAAGELLRSIGPGR
ncbi:MAG: sulfatase-like hydrolase/transferase [Vicinamibacterales bacterium]